MASDRQDTFDIIITGTPPYSVTVTGPDTDGPIRTTLPAINEWLTDDLRRVLAEMGAEGSPVRGEEIQKVGEGLYKALFKHEIERAFFKAQGSVKDRGLRLRLQVEPPELAALPWEAMHDGEDWVAARGDVPQVRRLAAQTEGGFPQRLGVKGALRILFVGASPDGMRGLDVAGAAADLETRLTDAIKEKRIELKIVLNAGLADIDEALSETEGRGKKPWHILYFAGHGRHDAICLDDGTGDPIAGQPPPHRTAGDPDWVSAETLARKLGDTDIRLVFLAACETGGEAGGIAGLLENFASELTRRLALPAIVAMQYEISDLMANDLTSSFFSQVAAFEPVDSALSTARATLITNDEVSRDVIAPVMYLQADDSALFRKASNWALVGLLALLPILALVAGIAGYAMLSRAKAEAIALSQTLAKQSQDNVPERLDLALLLGAQAIRSADTVEARAALATALESNPALEAFLHEPSAANQKSSLLNTILAASNDGKLLASAGNRFDGELGSIQLWDWTHGQPVGQPLTGYEAPVTGLDFSDDGRTLVSGHKDNTFLLWDIASGTILDRRSGPSDSIDAIGLAPDGQILVLSYDRLWNAGTGEALGPPPGSIEVPTGSAAFSPDGSWIARGGCASMSHSGCGSGAVMLINVQSGQVLPIRAEFDQAWNHSANVKGLAFSPDGKILASGDADGRVLLWDVENQRSLMKSYTARASSINGLAFGSDDKSLASALENGNILRWNLADEPLLSTFLAGNDALDVRVAFIPQSDALIVAASPLGADSTLTRLTQIRTNAEMPSSQASSSTDGSVTTFAVSPDGRLAASGDWTGTIVLWEMGTSPKWLDSLPGNGKSILDLGFTPDNQMLVAAADDATVIFWNLETKAVSRKQLGSSELSWGRAALSPDTQTLAVVASDNTIELWGIAREQQMASLSSGDNLIESLAFSSDGNSLVSGHQDGRIIFWDPVAGKRAGSELVGHKADVSTFAFSSDDGLLMSGSCVAYNPYHCLQGEVRLWDVPSRRLLAVHPTSLGGYVGDIAFRTDTKIAAIASADSGVLLFDLDIETWLARACTVANRNLSQTEWSTFVGTDRSYQCNCPNLPAGEGVPVDACEEPD